MIKVKGEFKGGIYGKLSLPGKNWALPGMAHFKNSYFKECRMAGWSCTDQKAKDRKICENEAVLQEIKIPIKYCTSPILQPYRTICSKPKSQCATQVRLPAIVFKTEGGKSFKCTYKKGEV